MLPTVYTKLHLFLVLFTAIIYTAVVAKLDPPIPCKSSNDCDQFIASTLKDTSCRNGFCACKNGTAIKNCSSTDIRFRNTGIPIVRSCRVDQDCTAFGNSFCNTTINQCDCQKDFVFSNIKKTCLRKAGELDFPCIEHKQCLALLPHTLCQDGQCACISGYHPVQNGCHQTIDIGESCTRSEECAHVIDAVCTDRGVCDCVAETVLDGERKKCLPVSRRILDKCVENVQCNTTFQNSLCINETCQCQDQYHFESAMYRCFANKGFGENCANTYECYQPEDEGETQKALTCVENVCVCVDNYARFDDICVNEGSRFLSSLLSTILVCIAFYGQY